MRRIHAILYSYLSCIMVFFVVWCILQFLAKSDETLFGTAGPNAFYAFLFFPVICLELVGIKFGITIGFMLLLSMVYLMFRFENRSGRAMQNTIVITFAYPSFIYILNMASILLLMKFG